MATLKAEDDRWSRTCPRCGWKWVPRVPKPKKCPACKNILKPK